MCLTDMHLRVATRKNLIGFLKKHSCWSLFLVEFQVEYLQLYLEEIHAAALTLSCIML